MRQNTGYRHRRFLIITADDLGRSSSVNTAIAEAHDRGILTAASLMVGGEAFEEAVKIALKRNRLSVGLHVTLCDGRAVLSYSDIPGLVDKEGFFEKSPERAWINYMKPGILPQIEAEVKAQFDRLEKAGIQPTHVDGHHHLQMHPLIFEAICRQASKRGVRWIRIPYESISIVFSLRSFNRGAMPFVEWVVFGILRAYNLKTAGKYDMNVPCRSLGLSWSGNIDEKCFADLFGHVGGEVNEIFTHPDIAADSGRRELEAISSIEVRSGLRSFGVELVGYRELSEKEATPDSLLESIESQKIF